MNRRYLSLISELIVFLTGALFFYLAQTTLAPAANFYQAAGFYPSLLSGAIMAGSLVGIVNDLLSLKKDYEKTDLGSFRNFALIVAIIVVMILIWRMLELFYLSIFFGTVTTLLIFNDMKKPWITKTLFTLAGGAVFTVLVYLLFTVLLKINF